MSTDTWAFRTLIVPADYRDLAATIASTIGGTAGEDMFTTGLSASGQEPATHYVSTGYIGFEFAAILPLDIYEADGTHVRIPGNPQAVVDLCAAQGLTVTLVQVEELFTASDISEQEPFTAFARMGLQIAQPVMPEA